MVYFCIISFWFVCSHRYPVGKKNGYSYYSSLRGSKLKAKIPIRFTPQVHLRKKKHLGLHYPELTENVKGLKYSNIFQDNIYAPFTGLPLRHFNQIENYQFHFFQGTWEHWQQKLDITNMALILVWNYSAWQPGKQLGPKNIIPAAFTVYD